MTPQEFIKRLRTVKMCANSFAQIVDLFLEYEKKYAEKREKVAERMRTVRARVREQQGNSPSYILTSLSSSLEPLKDTQKEKKEAAGARPKKRASCMPEDWQPSDHARDHLKQKSFSDEEIDHEVERLRNWAVANAKTSTNWDLNLYNWMDKPGRGVNGTHQQVQRPGLHEAARANLARARRGEPASDVFGEPSSGGGGISPRLLPRLRQG